MNLASALLLALLAGDLSGAARGGVGPAAVAWQSMGAGAARATLAAADGTPIALFRFDLFRFEARVVVGPGKPPRPESAAALRERLGAVAVVNGGFFDERRAPLGLRIASGETRVPLRPRVDWGVLVLKNEEARIIHSRDWQSADGLSGAIQVGPRLVVDGTPLKLKPAAGAPHGGGASARRPRPDAGDCRRPD